jgi:hypothetical protein
LVLLSKDFHLLGYFDMPGVKKRLRETGGKGVV